MTRKKFIHTAVASSGIAAAGSGFMKGATPAAGGTSTFPVGGDLVVKRMGFGGMRITEDGIWGWPVDRENAKKVLRRSVELARRNAEGKGE